MKNKLKTFLVALLVIPVAVVMVACGGNSGGAAKFKYDRAFIDANLTGDFSITWKTLDWGSAETQVESIFYTIARKGEIYYYKTEHIRTWNHEWKLSVDAVLNAVPYAELYEQFIENGTWIRDGEFIEFRQVSEIIIVPRGMYQWGFNDRAPDYPRGSESLVIWRNIYLGVTTTNAHFYNSGGDFYGQLPPWAGRFPNKIGFAINKANIPGQKFKKTGTETVAGRDCNIYKFEVDFIEQKRITLISVCTETGVTMKVDCEFSSFNSFYCIEFKRSNVEIPPLPAWIGIWNLRE